VADQALLQHGINLEGATLAWNVVGIVVVGLAAIGAGSVALAGFGLDSAVEIGASTVVLWELAGLAGTDDQRQHRALCLIGGAFIAVALYIAAQSTVVLITGYHPRPSLSLVGITWTAVTAGAMFGLAAGKSRTGRALHNPVLMAEGRVTFVDGVLAVTVLCGLVLNAVFDAWWADPVAGLVIVFYGLKEARAIFSRSP